jgi:hypothetical protein
MSAVIDGDNRVVLTGDNLGWSGARRELVAPVSGFDGMRVAFRAWWDSFTGTLQDNTSPGWDPVACFGLGFTNVFPANAGADGFFGIRGGTGAGALVANFFSANIFGTGKPGDFLYSNTVFNIYNSNTALTGGTNAMQYLPANPTVGEEFTGVWVIKRGLSADNIVVSLGWNMESLARANMAQAFTSPATTWTILNSSVTDGTHWRASGDMNFPQWFLLKNPSPTIGRKLVLDHVVIEYFKYNELD